MGFLKWKFKVGALDSRCKIIFYQVPLALNETVLPHYSLKLLLYFIIFLFTKQQMAPQCLLHSIQVPLFSYQGPLKCSLISYDHITHSLHSIRQEFFPSPNRLAFAHAAHPCLPTCSSPLPHRSKPLIQGPAQDPSPP